LCAVNKITALAKAASPSINGSAMSSWPLMSFAEIITAIFIKINNKIKIISFFSFKGKKKPSDKEGLFV
jgi:hypothetical protein